MPEELSITALSVNKRQLSSTTGLRNDDGPDDLTPPQATEDSDTVIVSKISHLHIMSIGINRPKKRNCIDSQTAEKLHQAFLDFEADESMHVAVLYGLGGNFCAGFDLDELAQLDEAENLANVIAARMIDRGPMGPTRMDLTKPVIAAIEGWCVAGGLELALMADLRIADSDSKMGVLNRRFGVPLIDGGTVRLPELIGLSRALDVILTGRIIEAPEALQMGLVNRVCGTGTAYGRAMHLAKELQAHPQECLRADRASAYHATFASRSLEQSLEHEANEGLGIISRESIAGAKKFVSGLGKHGKFNVTPVAEQQEWQIEFEELKKQELSKKKDN